MYLETGDRVRTAAREKGIVQGYQGTTQGTTGGI